MNWEYVARSAYEKAREIPGIKNGYYWPEWDRLDSLIKAAWIESVKEVATIVAEKMY